MQMQFFLIYTHFLLFLSFAQYLLEGSNLAYLKDGIIVV